jgi:N-acetylglutamate synthase-like GNAT family acetyltransferase
VTGVQIRLARPADADALAELIRSASLVQPERLVSPR